MAHGGARVGAGRKPRAVLSIAGRGQSNPQNESDSGVSVMPPEDLPSEQRDFWHRWASLAIEKRTLTVHTVPAFRLLCEVDAEKRETKATIDRDGRTFVKVTVDGSGQEHHELKAHPLTGSYGRLAKDVRTGMLSFGLAPFGKPESPIAKRTAANPFAALAAK